MSRHSVTPPAWHDARSQKLKGTNPRLAKRLTELESGLGPLAEQVAKLKEANDRLERLVKK
jgi:hypothetical protein